MTVSPEGRVNTGQAHQTERSVTSSRAFRKSMTSYFCHPVGWGSTPPQPFLMGEGPIRREITCSVFTKRSTRATRAAFLAEPTPRLGLHSTPQQAAWTHQMAMGGSRVVRTLL